MEIHKIIAVLLWFCSLVSTTYNLKLIPVLKISPECHDSKSSLNICFSKTQFLLKVIVMCSLKSRGQYLCSFIYLSAHNFNLQT